MIPSEAQAKLTCRLVPDQQPRDILEKLSRHLHEHLPPAVRLEVRPDNHGAAPYHIPVDHPGLAMAASVMRAMYGKEPLYVRAGGTLPVSALFKRLLGLETVFFSFSTADEDFHAPNEFFRIHRFAEGLEAWVRYWEALGSAEFH